MSDTDATYAIFLHCFSQRCPCAKIFFNAVYEDSKIPSTYLHNPDDVLCIMLNVPSINSYFKIYLLYVLHKLINKIDIYRYTVIF